MARAKEIDLATLPPLSVGACKCGCGAPAPLAQRTNKRLGHTRGARLSYLPGHNSKHRTDLSRFVVTDAGYQTPCWLWCGSLNRKGYARAQVNGEHTGAHRALYESKHGPLQQSVQLDHLCKNRRCVRPDHMEPVSNAVNSRRTRRTRLSEERVAAIRASEKPQSEIAAEHGVARQTVSDVLRGDTWKQRSALALVHRMIAVTGDDA